jgi:RNA polymerase sigma-70 factor (ECF subfamily)
VFLDSLRVVLAVADGTATQSATPRGPGSPDQSAAGPPADMERVAALVELAQGGDADAFGLLYERYVDLVYRYIYVRVGATHVAEDLTSETFVRALRRIDSFSWQGKDIAAWFVTIARNLITDNAKSARYRMEVTTADMIDADRRVEGPESEVLSRLRDTRLFEAIKKLKPEQAECVVLRFMHGMSLAETALVVGKSEGAIKQLQLRAVRSLHRELGGEMP